MNRKGLRARHREHFVYSGRSLLAANLEGEVTGSGTEGFYHENTRLLSLHELIADGKPLKPIGPTPVTASSFLAYGEVRGSNVPKEKVYVEIARSVGQGLREELRVENYAPHESARFELAIHLAADFADIREVEKGEREQSAEVETSWQEARGELMFRYRHPKLDRVVAVRVERSSAPVRFQDGALVVTLELAPHERGELHLLVEPVFDGERRAAPGRVFDETATPLGRVRRRLRDEMPRLVTTNATVAQAGETATEDLASLPLGLPSGPALPAAGIPLYQYLFGRDALTTAWQALLAAPSMMRDTLRVNAANQGGAIDDWFDEEPGKLIQQGRQGPLAALGITPHTRYYGDYAAPQDFLIMLGQYLAWTGDLETVRQLLPAARKAIEWLERYGDLDGDGFLEYATRSEEGDKNQGWKDSRDAIVDERGEMVANPLATSEVQAYWYAGLRQVAIAFLAAGDRAYALKLLGEARDLKRRFDEAYWMEEEGFYALALGPDKRQVRSIASNAGHLLATGIVPVEKGRRVARRLMQPDLFSGWGIRTLSSDHISYNPFSYHLGSVWPVENGTFALGFGRYGCFEELHRLAEGIFAATGLFEANRLPESLGGLPRDELHPHPGIYPKASEPQAWSASMIVLLIQTLLGMRPMAPLGLLLVDPQLPLWLPDLRLKGIQIGRARIDLEAQRASSGETHYRITRREGRVRVLRQPPPQAPDSSVGHRARAALVSLLYS